MVSTKVESHRRITGNLFQILLTLIASISLVLDLIRRMLGACRGALQYMDARQFGTRYQGKCVCNRNLE